MSEKVALVTGGNRGIGLETVKQLANRGVSVVMGSRSLKKGEEAKREGQRALISWQQVRNFLGQ